MHIVVQFECDAAECHQCRMYAAELMGETPEGRRTWVSHMVQNGVAHPDLETTLAVMLGHAPDG